jgi:HSP20 family protein
MFIVQPFRIRAVAAITFGTHSALTYGAAATVQPHPKHEIAARTVVRVARELVIRIGRRYGMHPALRKNRLNHLLPAGFREFDSLFNQFARADEATTWRAPASIWEADSVIHVELDAPGVKQEDVGVTFDKGTLHVSLERKAPEVERTSWHNERGYGKVTRSVGLPETVDPNTITAELTSGVLHATITKLPEAQPKKVEVKVS